MNMDTNNKNIEFLGTIVSQRFRDENSGYTIFLVSPAKKGPNDEDIICTGVIPDYINGTPVSIKGYWELNKKFQSRQIRTLDVNICSFDIATTATFITSICDITPTIAIEIAKYVGNDISSFVLKEDAAEELSKNINKLDYDLAVVLINILRNNILVKRIYDLLGTFGIKKYNAAVKIAKKYDLAAEESLKMNPYSVGLFNGLSFADCDSIAAESGIKGVETSSIRLTAAVEAAQRLAAENGHMYSLLPQILSLSNGILKKSGLYKRIVPPALLINAIEKSKNTVFEMDDKGCEAVYLKKNLELEKNISKQITRLMSSREKLNYSKDISEQLEKELNIKYAPAQKKAFSLAKETGVAVLTGGPGTGKTTTVNGILMAIERQNPSKSIALVAPTGRAAQRMTESTHREASTIHRLLNYSPFGGGVTYKTQEDPIDADIIIVDESSMIDAELCSIFLSAVKPGSLVLFIGDTAQLPSVGAGTVLKDLITSGIVPVVRLKTVFRQGEESSIIRNSELINNGDYRLPLAEDFQLYFRNDEEGVADYLIACGTDYFNRKNPFYSQILIPTKNGVAGVKEINRRMQERINPKAPDKKELKYGEDVFRIGDKVLLTQNNYEQGYFNGDIGIIEDINEKSLLLNINGKSELDFPKSCLEDLSLAYAMTVHKSQGSEFPITIIGLTESKLLQRNLLYTAVTRAKNIVIIMAQIGSVKKAVDNKEISQRRSRLKKRLKGEI